MTLQNNLTIEITSFKSSINQQLHILYVCIWSINNAEYLVGGGCHIKPSFPETQIHNMQGLTMVDMNKFNGSNPT